MICERNSDNKYGFISLILRHLHLLFKQWMLPEKKSGFCSQHDKRFMQLRQRDILGNYAEKNGGTARIALLINSPFVRKVTGRVAQMRDRVACPWSQYKNSPATKPFVREQRHRGIFPFPQKKSPAGSELPTGLHFYSETSTVTSLTESSVIM